MNQLDRRASVYPPTPFPERSRHHRQTSLWAITTPVTSSQRSMSQPAIHRCPHRMRNHHNRRRRRPLDSVAASAAEAADQDQQEDNSRNPWIQYLIAWALRFVPILIATMGLLCLMAFLFDTKLAMAVFNVTVVIIFTIIFFFIVYTMVMYYIYRRYYAEQQHQLQPQPRQSHRQQRSRSRTIRRHTMATILLRDSPQQQQQDFELVAADLDDDDDYECYHCRTERLKATDVPPPYEPPPAYEQLDPKALMMEADQHLLMATGSGSSEPDRHQTDDHQTLDFSSDDDDDWPGPASGAGWLPSTT